MSKIMTKVNCKVRVPECKNGGKPGSGESRECQIDEISDLFIATGFLGTISGQSLTLSFDLTAGG